MRAEYAPRTDDEGRCWWCMDRGERVVGEDANPETGPMASDLIWDFCGCPAGDRLREEVWGEDEDQPPGERAPWRNAGGGGEGRARRNGAMRLVFKPVTIDVGAAGDQAFWAWCEAGEQWDGFEVPAFDEATADRVMAWANASATPELIEWEGYQTIQKMSGPEYAIGGAEGVETIVWPSELEEAGEAVYRIGAHSWCWVEAEHQPEDCPRCRGAGFAWNQRRLSEYEYDEPELRPCWCALGWAAVEERE
jgi:hypothetical protein